MRISFNSFFFLFPFVFRDQFTKKIQEQENLGKVLNKTISCYFRFFFVQVKSTHAYYFAFVFQSLRDKQKSVRESQAPNMKQMKMWSVSTFLIPSRGTVGS